jgi:hypothetical protein
VATLTLRIDLLDHGAIGPGKIRLFELVIAMVVRGDVPSPARRATISQRVLP